jgi:hypothetical protein
MKRTSHRLSRAAIGMLVARATRRVQALHSQVVRRMGYQRFLPLTVIAGLMTGCGGGSSPTSVAPIPPPRSEHLGHNPAIEHCQ